MESSLLGRIGVWSYRNRKRVLFGWVVLLIAFLAVGRSVGSQFKDNITGGSTEAQQAASFLESRFPARAGDVAQVVFTSNRPLTTPARERQIADDLQALRALPHVVSVGAPFAVGGTDQVSTSGRIAYGIVRFDASGDSLADSAINAVVDRARQGAGPGVGVQVGGAPIEKVEKPAFGKSEGLGILAAIVILLLVFGSVIAMMLPIVSALIGVGATFGVLDVLSHTLTVPSFAPELAALVGLGVGIDYALFVVTRFRRSVYSGATPEDAVATAMATSGRAVLFAGSTVVLSLLGLFLLGLPFIYGASLGTVCAVLFVVAASLTLLPAGLGLAGSNIDRFRVGRRRTGVASAEGQAFWARWSRQVQRRPVVAGGASLLVLVVLAIPFLSLRLAFTDARTAPTSYTSRQAADLLARGFGPGAIGPLVVAAELPSPNGVAAVSQLRGRLGALPDVQAVSRPELNPAGTAAVIEVTPRTGPQDAATATLVQTIRRSVGPEVADASGVRVLVGGETAASIDTSNLISRHLGLVIAFVVFLSLLILAAAFRSVVIPVASAVATLLSTGAAYGVIVAVFQWGWLGAGIDNRTTAPVDPWIPVMLFALLLGLSMDYQVFLVSRIREARLAGRRDHEAVTEGLASTGRVITSAALIMICVFGAFVLGDLRVLKVFGFAMAVAVLLDATLVRMVLMPAALQLIGRAAWWVPGHLERIVSTVGEPVPVPVRAHSHGRPR